jgi:GTP-dependent phosphoenolpyruvate carboxykinase
VNVMLSKLVVAWVAVLAVGCSGSLQQAKMEGAPMRVGLTAAQSASALQRCQSLDSRRANWGGVAKFSAVLSGGSGLASIPLNDDNKTEHGVKVGLEIGTVVSAAVAAAAFYMAESQEEAWARECSSGQ